MKSRGFSAEAVLAGSGINATRLAEVGYLVDIDQTNVVLGNIIRLIGDNGIGFELGMQSELTDSGVVAYAMMSSRTVRDALELWIRYSNSLVGTFWSVHEHRSGPDRFTVEVTEELPTVGGPRFCAEEFISITYKAGIGLAHDEPVFLRMELAYPEPPYAERYRALCKGPVEFNARKTLITLNAQWVDKELMTTDSELNEICVRYCAQLADEIARSRPMLAKIRAMVRADPAAIPRFDDVARQLGLSSRTLRRRLAEEGVNFHDIVNEIKLGMAKRYAEESTMTAKQISYALGYANVSSFNRMFTAMMGKTLQQYRRQRPGPTPR